MKNMTIQTVNEQGEVLFESNLNVKEGDILVQTINELHDRPIPKSIVETYHSKAKEVLSADSDVKVMTIPHFVKLSVISVK